MAIFVDPTYTETLIGISRMKSMFFGAPPASVLWTGGNEAGCGDGLPVVCESARIAGSVSAMVSLSMRTRSVQYFGHAAGVIPLVNSRTPLKLVIPLDVAIQWIPGVLVEQNHIAR